MAPRPQGLHRRRVERRSPRQSALSRSPKTRNISRPSGRNRMCRRPRRARVLPQVPRAPGLRARSDRAMQDGKSQRGRDGGLWRGSHGAGLQHRIGRLRGTDRRTFQPHRAGRGSHWLVGSRSPGLSITCMFKSAPWQPSIRRSEARMNRRNYPPGRYTVILEPAAVAGLLSWMIWMLDAKAFYNSQSLQRKDGHAHSRPETVVAQSAGPCRSSWTGITVRGCL